MSDKRITLHKLLVKLFESDRVYYQPPENLKMEYPAIRYSKSDIINKYADNIKYLNKKRYEILVIDSRVDNKVIDKILQLPYTSYDRHYTSNNLNYDSITIYF